MKSLLYICEQWPNAYKPTWNMQISAFLELGLKIDVVHCGSEQTEIPAELAEAVSAGKLRIYQYPSTLRNVLPVFGHHVFALCNLLRRLFFFKKVRSSQKKSKEKLMEYARFCCIPETTYDFVLVKNLNCAADYSELPKLLECRNLFSVYYHGGAVEGVPPSYLKYTASIFSNYELFFTNTNYSKGELISIGAPAPKVQAVPVGVSEESHCGQRNSYRPNGVLRILSASRLSKEKGIIYAIEAVQALIAEGIKNIRYDIVGNGAEEKSLKEYVAENKLSAWINFHGRQPNSEVISKFLPDSDVFLNPCYPTATWAETQCVAIQEAALKHVPTVASRCGGIPEVIVDEKTGLLTEIQSVESIARALKTTVEMSEARLSQMGQSAYDFAKTNFNVMTVTERLFKAMHKSDLGESR